MNTLLEAISRRAQTSPDEPLFIQSDGSLAASEVLARVKELSLRVRSLDVSVIALLADNCTAWALLDIACQLEGIRIIPLPTFFSARQIRHLLHSAGVDIVFYQPQLATCLSAVETVELPRCEALSQFALARPVGVQPSLAPPGTGKITFTSGSTGEPKGVCLSFEQCLGVATSLSEAIPVPNPRHLCVLPLSTLLENIGGLYMPLLANGSAILLSSGELGIQGSSGLDAPVFLEAIARWQPNTLILVPQLLAVLDAALMRGWSPPDSLRFVAVGGARVSPAAIKRVRDRGLPVYEGYGLSECASVVSLNRPGADRPGTSGKILPHVEVFSRDGELLVRGNSFLGYLNQPDSWGESTIATGDLGAVDADGFVTVQGRRKNVLVSSFGRNISPEWVETELLADNMIQQAVVVGDGRPCCAALLSPRDASLTTAAIQASVDGVNRRLPDYARIGPWLRLEQPLSTANGLLTDNGRPKREAIYARYGVRIDHLYQNHRESLAS